jgi:cytosine/adenosine deaminase-related metal-dependent hydrolase
MRYRKFQADYLFTGKEIREDKPVLICDGEGAVQDLVKESEAGGDIQALQGMLCPGFINCHCHLELSHLRGRFPEKSGLTDFVYQVVRQRDFPGDQILEAISRAEEQMILNGIVAVGDICNNILSLSQKKKQFLLYHNFIEVSGWSPAAAADRFATSLDLFTAFSAWFPERTSMAPHAPYSVSDPLWQMIRPYYRGKTTTIHNQESRAEDDLFLQGSGDLLRMYELMRIDNRLFRPSGKSSLATSLPKMGEARNLLLVHNSFTREEDLRLLTGQENGPECFICLCIQANQYIENVVPPVNLFRQHRLPIVLGTDSLASNRELSILAEIKTLRHFFPEIPFGEILGWATLEGSRALQCEEHLGSFETGKKPGILLIGELEHGEAGQDSTIERIL